MLAEIGLELPEPMTLGVAGKTPAASDNCTEKVGVPAKPVALNDTRTPWPAQ